MSGRQIVVLPGDGIGPEVTAAAVRVLRVVAEREGVELELREELIGAAAERATGSPFPDQTRAAVAGADAVLLGAVGDPAADALPPERRPEAGLLALRAAMGVWANLRPVVVEDVLLDGSPIRPERLTGTDMLIVRELLGGIYFGTPRGRSTTEAFDTMRYTVPEIERIAHLAFRAAQQRRGRVLSVDKANVLESSRLWRETVNAVAAGYPDVALEHGLVDSVAMRLVQAPASIDVLLTENLFGDILSDEAGVLVGSLGLLPSASLGDGAGLFEPIHGSAPTLAGKDIANPVGAIRSAAMLALHGLRLPAVARRIERAVSAVLDAGLRTADLGGNVGTTEFTDAVIVAVEAVAPVST